MTIKFTDGSSVKVTESFGQSAGSTQKSDADVWIEHAVKAFNPEKTADCEITEYQAPGDQQEANAQL